MTSYNLQEAVCSLPDDWKDTSVNIFSVGTTAPAEFSLVVTRDVLGSSISLKAFADAQLERLSQTLSRYVLLRQEGRVFGDKTAIDSEFTWISESRRIHQRQVLLQHDADRVLIFTATALDFLAADRSQQMDAILGGLEWRVVGGPLA